MKKLSKITSVILAGSAAMLIGCGGGGGSSHHKSSDKNVTITAADAYVVGLPTPATVIIGDKLYPSIAVNNGKITFTVPANADVTASEFNVPGNAIVDTDGDGKLSPKDQVIRMPLKTMGEGSSANPIATAALARGDNKAFEAAKNFDPVEAKKQLILNPDDPKTKALVAVSDGIAELAKTAKEKGIDPLEVVKEVNTEIVQQVVSNPEMVTTQDITDVVQEVVKTAAQKAQVDPTEVAQKVKKVVEVIETAAKAVKEGKLDPEKALVAIVAVSDADLDPEVAKQALEEGNIDKVVESIPENPVVQQVIEQQQQEQAQENEQQQEQAEEQAQEQKEEAEEQTPEIEPTPVPTPSKPKKILNDLVKVEKVTVGDTNISYAKNFKVAIPKDNNTSKYYDVQFEGECLDTGTVKTSLEVNITTDNDKYVALYIPDENVTVTCNAVGKKPKTTIPEGTKVYIATNVKNVENAIDGNTTYATLDKDLVNHDLGFNVSTLKNAAVQKDTDKLEKMENTLGDYLEKEGKYNVDVIVGDDTLKGTVRIGNDTPKLSLDRDNINLEEGNTTSIEYNVTDFDNITVTAESNDTDVASVSLTKTSDANGTITVTGKGEGTATITVKACDEFGACTEQNVSVEVKKSGGGDEENNFHVISSDFNNTTLTETAINAYHIQVVAKGNFIGKTLTVETNGTVPQNKPVSTSDPVIYIVETANDQKNYLQVTISKSEYSGQKLKFTVDNKSVEINVDDIENNKEYVLQ